MKWWSVLILSLVVLSGCIGSNEIDLGELKVPVYEGMKEEVSLGSGFLNMVMREKGSEFVLKVYSINGDKIADIEEFYDNYFKSQGFNENETYTITFLDQYVKSQGDNIDIKIKGYMNEEKNYGVVMYLIYDPDNDRTIIYMIAAKGNEFKETYVENETYEETVTYPEEEYTYENQETTTSLSLPEDFPLQIYGVKSIRDYGSTTYQGIENYYVSYISDSSPEELLNQYEAYLRSEGYEIVRQQEPSYINLIGYKNDRKTYYDVRIYEEVDAIYVEVNYVNTQ